jgi:hypothetical protein
MAVSEANPGIRGPSSPDLGQERPTDRVRPSASLDLGIRDDLDGKPHAPIVGLVHHEVPSFVHHP